MKWLLVLLFLGSSPLRADALADLGAEYAAWDILEPAVVAVCDRTSPLLDRCYARLRLIDTAIDQLPEGDRRREIGTINYLRIRERTWEADTLACGCGTCILNGNGCRELSLDLHRTIGERLGEAIQANAWYRGGLGNMRAAEEVLMEVSGRLDSLELYLTQ